jgi:hypothetical protein
VLSLDESLTEEKTMESYKLMMLAFVRVSSVLVAEAFGAAASNMTQNVAAGGVTTKVTYLNANSADEPRFHIVLDTHSVNLDVYDFKKVAVLRDDGGESYGPTAAENKGGGHHREVTLSFPKFTPGSKRVELVIKDIAGVKERTFVWNLE